MMNPRRQLREDIEAVARQQFRRRSGSIPYRSPLFGYASAHDERFIRLKQLASPGHTTPGELLPTARTVMVVFLPFGAPVVESNRDSPVVARLWAEAYVEANELLAEVMDALTCSLIEWGYPSLSIAPTGEFDPQTLTARWSHRHAGVLAGLGQLGLNRMLITRLGCAGRLASLVTTASLGATQPGEAFCHRCGECARACPAGALKPDARFDRQACYRYLRQVAAIHSDLKEAEVCGKCVTGSCSIL